MPFELQDFIISTTGTGHCHLGSQPCVSSAAFDGFPIPSEGGAASRDGFWGTSG